MRLVPARVLVLSSLVLGAGCQPDFDPATLLGADSLRLLAVRAEPPEVAVGQKTTLSALVIDTAGTQAQDIAVDWSWCTLGRNAAATSAINPDCLSREGGPFLRPLGSGHSIDLTIAELDFTTLGLPDATLGLYIPLRVSVRAPGVEAGDPPRLLDGVYRLRVHPPQSPLPPNQNPDLAGMWLLPEEMLDGGPTHPAVPDGFTSIPDAGTGITRGAMELPAGGAVTAGGDGWTLRALFADGAPQHYLTLDTDPLSGEMKLVDKQELLTVRWYATTGRVAEPVTGVEVPDTRIVIADPPMTPEELRLKPYMIPAPGAIVDVYAVGRDERGGTSWLHRQLRKP